MESDIQGHSVVLPQYVVGGYIEVELKTKSIDGFLDERENDGEGWHILLVRVESGVLVDGLYIGVLATRTSLSVRIGSKLCVPSEASSRELNK